MSESHYLCADQRDHCATVMERLLGTSQAEYWGYNWRKLRSHIHILTGVVRVQKLKGKIQWLLPGWNIPRPIPQWFPVHMICNCKDLLKGMGWNGGWSSVEKLWPGTVEIFAGRGTLWWNQSPWMNLVHDIIVVLTHTSSHWACALYVLAVSLKAKQENFTPINNESIYH